jgi:hypothetical protein
MVGKYVPGRPQPARPQAERAAIVDQLYSSYEADVALEAAAETASPAASAALEVGRLLSELETYICRQSDMSIDYATAARTRSRLAEGWACGVFGGAQSGVSFR